MCVTQFVFLRDEKGEIYHEKTINSSWGFLSNGIRRIA